MPRARVRFKPPTDPGGGPFWLSRAFPDGAFRVLSAYPDGEGLLVLLEARVADPIAVRDHFEAAPATFIPAVEVLHDDEETLLLELRLPSVPAPFRALLDSGNLPQFPYDLEDGWMVCELTTSHERLSRFGDELAATGFSVEVVWVSQAVDPAARLTDRQRRFVAAAIERGYYDTPRRCTLSALADHLDVSKSTASVVLHRAEETIVKDYFAEPVE